MSPRCGWLVDASRVGGPAPIGHTPEMTQLPDGAGAAPTPEVLLDLAITVATRAGELLMDGLRWGNLTVETKTSSTDMVSEMDRAAERLIVDELRSARPNDAIVGEEGANDDGTSGVCWVVDPIDGTTNYLYGLHGFAVSIAAELDGTTVAGVVNVPMHQEIFTATLGAGARRNGDAISVTAIEDPSMALVATGFSYEPGRRRRQAIVLQRVLPAVRDLRRLGAASVDLCAVACGRVDGYYERGLQPWDYAAGALVATEAGALVGDLDGGPASGEFTLAANPVLWPKLAWMLDDAGARHA
jgi:myo-inositol-1(or 4)-monophosphatase